MKASTVAMVALLAVLCRAAAASVLDDLETTAMLSPAECKSLRCENGGMLDAANCKCACAYPYHGRTCRTCARHCKNGGELDSSTCQCNCAAGFDGHDCSHTQGAPLPARHHKAAHKNKFNVPDVKLDELKVQTIANALDKVDSVMGCTAGDACNHWLYTVCHGSEDKDDAGRFIVMDELFCTRWMTGPDALKVLMHPLAGDLSDFVVKRQLMPEKEALDLPKEEDETPAVGTDEVVLGNKVGFLLCRVAENEEYNNPAATGGINVMEHAVCTEVMDQEMLAKSFVFALTQADATPPDEEPEAPAADPVNTNTATTGTTTAGTHTATDLNEKKPTVVGSNTTPAFLNHFLQKPPTMDLAESQSRAAAAAEIMDKARAAVYSGWSGKLKNIYRTGSNDMFSAGTDVLSGSNW